MLIHVSLENGVFVDYKFEGVGPIVFDFGLVKSLVQGHGAPTQGHVVGSCWL